MFLTIETTAPQADELGHVLAKHPDRMQSFDVSAGQATVFYPVSGPDRCQAALLVDVDAARLAASRGFRGDDHALSAFVNDRVYAASSLLTVAIARVFGSALNGRCPARPELAERAWPLTIHVPTACGTPQLARDLFDPLGWTVLAESDGAAPVDLTLSGTARVQDALAHLYILLPVLDDAKHYWVGEFETEKLVRHGGDWLAGHPARELIMGRYLAHQRAYVADATERLLAGDGVDADTTPARSAEACFFADGFHASPDAEASGAPSLAAQRREAIIAALLAAGARSVVDLGCGEGRLVTALLAEGRFDRVVGADVSPGVLARAQAALDQLPERARARGTLLQTSATYRDARLAGFDAIVLSEVVEHLDPDRLPALVQTVFGDGRPAHVLVTTPNTEYNALFPALPAGRFRHLDHRFEWTRAEFEAWARGVAAGHGYDVAFDGVGPADESLGSPTQLAVFTRSER